MSMRRVLLTGAAGFIGASLARRLLADGHHVELLLRPGSDPWRLEALRGELVVHEADLRDQVTVESTVAAARADWVFHLAAHGGYSWQTDSRGIFESNAIGTLNLAGACVRSGFEAFVHAGTSSEYGLKDHAPSELEAAEPNSAYAVAKVTATLLCRQLAVQHGLRLATLRLYSVYGEWEDPRRLLPTLVVHSMRGELPPLVNPDTGRDFVHIDDACDAFLRAAGTPVPGSSQIYNLGSGVETSLRVLVEIVQGAFGVAVAPQWGSHEPRRWDAPRWVADPAKITEELGWRPRRSLREGVTDLATWIRTHPSLHERYGVRA